MKTFGAVLVLFSLHACRSHFIPTLPFNGGLGLFGNVASAPPREAPIVFGTASELRQLRARFPNMDPTRFVEIDEPRLLPMQPSFFGKVSFDSGYGAPMRPVGAYAQPIEEPEAPVPHSYGKPSSNYPKPEPSYGMPAPSYGKPTSSYGKPTSSYGKPTSSYGKPEPTYGKPVSSYPQPGVGPSYGKPEQPIDVEASPVPEAADLPSVNEGSAPNWVSNEDSTQTEQHTSITQTVSSSSSSSSSSISQTASISSEADNSHDGSESLSSTGSESLEPSSNSEQSGNSSISVLQDVSVQQTGPNETNADFFPPQLPTDQSEPSFTSDNVIRPASRPASTPSQESISENTVDVENSAEHMPSSSNIEPEIPHSSSQEESNAGNVVQEASVHQAVDEGSDSSSASHQEPDAHGNLPFVSDNVIRPASRPASVPSSVSTHENDLSPDSAIPASSGSSSQIVQSASSASGSVIQDASIEQNVDDGVSAGSSAHDQPISHDLEDTMSGNTANTLVEQSVGEGSSPAVPEVPETLAASSRSDDQQVGADESGRQEQDLALEDPVADDSPSSDDSQLQGSEPDVFVTKHSTASE